MMNTFIYFLTLSQTVINDLEKKWDVLLNYLIKALVEDVEHSYLREE